MCLVADDHEDSRLLIQTFLSAARVTRSHRPGGREALREAPLFRPDVVFLDIWMPGMGGIETCQRLRDGPCPQPVPIYGVTADWKHFENPDRCFDAVLAKPVDLIASSLRYATGDSLDRCIRLHSPAD